MTRASSFRPQRRDAAFRRAGAGGDRYLLPVRPTVRAERSPVRQRRPVHFGRIRSQATASNSTNGNKPMAWTFLCTVEITNFSELRRLLGVTEAAQVIDEVAQRISSLLPAARIHPTGRASLEFGFESDNREALDAALELTLKRLAASPESAECGYRLDVALAGVACRLAVADEVRIAEAIEEAAAVARREHRIVIYDLDEATGSLDRAGLNRDLAGAIARGEMCLHYQPKLHVRRQEVTGVEALVRWRHPERGLIYPGDFIPAAEEARVIADLTLWTLDQVIADQRRLAAAGHDLEIFINISGQLLNDAGFIADACDRVRVANGKIGFAITETSVIRDPETAIAHLREIAAIGVPIAIDDYGAGLSSLAYLKQLPARELKIDKMFVIQLTSSNRDPLIVRSTIDLAHAMEMEVTAEGVETQAALALLSVMGCDMVQGFLISRPVSLEALLQFLDDNHYFTGAEVARGSFNQPASFWKRA